MLSLAESDRALIPALSSEVAKLDPESRHAFVVRGLASDNDDLRALALRQLAELPPDPGQDTFARYWAEPVLRRAILSDDGLCEIFCPHLRRELRAQALGLHEAATILDTIGRLWGGVTRAQVKVNEDRAASLERAAAWHQHATELGPPTEQEWAIWRALRRQAIDEEPEVSATSLLLVRPAGPMDPDDREIIDWLMARWRRARATASESGELRDDRNLLNDTLKLYFALSRVEEAHVLAAFEELLAATDRLLDDVLVEMIEEQVQKLRAALP